jgi:hypothetical protein
LVICRTFSWVTTLAGSGVTGSVNGTGTAVGFYYPFGITVDSSGNVYVEDNGIKLLKSSFPAQAVVSGTYAVGNDQVSINLKLIELSEGRILSSIDYTLPTSDWFNL